MAAIHAADEVPMTERRLYFDHNASAPLLDEARDALLRALHEARNPSSVHAEGRRARTIVEDARGEVARLVHASREGVIFTSGASEAANAALSPVWHRGGTTIAVRRLAVAATDHPCFREAGRLGPDRLTVLPVDRNGHLVRAALENWLAAGTGDGIDMVALTLANNESGVIQPIAPVREAIGGRDVLLVLDVVQMAGRAPLDIAVLGADALILSGHKIGAVPGIGALVLRDPETAPAALIVGGGQERRHRAGTEAVPAIASFGAAARIAAARTENECQSLQARRDALQARLVAAGAVVLGVEAERLCNTIFFAAPGLRTETAQIALDLQGIAVSGGSACASGKVGASPVLAAHAAAGLPIDPLAGALRISFGFSTGDDELKAVGDALVRLLDGAARSDLDAQAA